MSRNWPTVFNLVNSVIGVSVLAMPFCFHQCGIILGPLAMISSALLTKKSCELLLKGGHVARKRSYEALALHSYGRSGKLLVEASIIGLLCGTLIAFQVIIGDLAPDIFHNLTGIQASGTIRAFLMTALAALVGLPLSMMKNLQSLSSLSALTLIFYFIFITQMFFKSLPNLVDGSWMTHVHLWKPAGLLHCLPIFSLAYACQTQIFVLYESLPEPSVKKMDAVVSTALNLVSLAYLSVGIFGYICFYDVGVNGDILTNFGSSFVIDLLKLGFMLSVIVSFPLMVYPMRSSLHSLMFLSHGSGPEGMSTPSYIPHNRFVYLTVGIVFLTLLIGILIPEIEFVLALNGATMGTLIAFVYPASMFLHIVQEKSITRLVSKVVLTAGLICLVTSTFTVLTTPEKPHQTDIHPPGVDPIRPVGGFQVAPINVTKPPLLPADAPQEFTPVNQVIRTESPIPLNKDVQVNNVGVQKREEPPVPQDPDVKPRLQVDPPADGKGVDTQRQLMSKGEEDNKSADVDLSQPVSNGSVSVKDAKITEEEINAELKKLEDKVPGVVSAKFKGEDKKDGQPILKMEVKDEKKVKRDLDQVELQPEVVRSESKVDNQVSQQEPGSESTVTSPVVAGNNYSSVNVKARDLKHKAPNQFRNLLSKKYRRSKRNLKSKAR